MTRTVTRKGDVGNEDGRTTTDTRDTEAETANQSEVTNDGAAAVHHDETRIEKNTQHSNKHGASVKIYLVARHLKILYICT